VITVNERPGLEPPEHDFQQQEFQLDKPLGFVRQEPLSSMLSVVREPPPMLQGLPSFGSSGFKSPPTEGIAQNEKKLAATGLVLGLAQLVINRESEIDATGNPGLQQGLEEVHRFLVHNQHLRTMRQT